jgi:hypothetical protein
MASNPNMRRWHGTKHAQMMTSLVKHYCYSVQNEGPSRLLLAGGFLHVLDDAVHIARNEDRILDGPRLMRYVSEAEYERT